jgi:hypothetical protein
MTRAIRLMLLAAVMVAVPAASFGAVFVSVTIAPPLLPVYAQPICPGEGYIWVPGYWAYGDYGYYWVPGTWVLAPFIGALWTPGYWGWGDGLYLWHEGYWGPYVGFYGGINYGFGYVGFGYAGGYWNHGSFYYNSTVNNVDRTIVHNVYSRTVINNNATMNRVSFNGGSGGTTARPTATQLATARSRHSAPTSAQVQLRRSASTNRAQLASVNHGRPAMLATARPAAFNRAAQNNAATRGPARRTANSAAGAPPMASSARTNRQPTNHSVARVAPNRAPAAQSTPRRTQQLSRTTAPPSRYSARNNPAPRSNPQPRYQAPPPSHYSARNNPAPRPTSAQPHYSAPVQRMPQPHQGAARPQNAPQPSRGGGNPRGREGGHG